ncbi:hypothetical protein PIB30_085171 [Stylosanthes scabra]|uniref:Uncharacterized protein n=1 Tax=Stylosanthes scabra TaxID=79078 RepID=A0ABU6UV67_9FABA|nr:hypothetical protein [Stylosanthes scabra]
MGNENSTESSASDETQNVPRKKLWRPPTRAEEVVYPEQRRKKPLSNDDAFNSFIIRGKHKFRTMATFVTRRREEDISHTSPNVANNPIPAVKNSSANNKDDQKDNNFSDFIKHTKKKLRTTTIVGRNSSVKRG